MTSTDLFATHTGIHSTRKTLLHRPMSFFVLLVLVSVLAKLSTASECSACGYLAKNCSSSAASDVVDVCDASGSIQIDDVFCNGDECRCAAGHSCVSTTVGCTNLFQAKNRRRCLGNATLSRRFQQCAIGQDLTVLNASNLVNDWIFFKQPSKCVSTDCLAVKMFHQSGLVQCGQLLAAWKTNSSSDVGSVGETTTYHFVADGSRGSDMKAGTFHYKVPWAAETVELVTNQANSSAVESCYALQTRNQLNGTCDGVYLQFDASVQYAQSDEYVMSSLSWPVWLAVVGSVAAAIAAIIIVGVVMYRFQRMDLTPPIDEDEDGGLLGGLDLSNSPNHRSASPSSLGSTSPASGRGAIGADLRQRPSGALPINLTKMEAGTSTTTL
ncbi:hypothetical protein PHYBOEH_009130 [Phytophthora boehmeriae]|uniref:Membrane-associated protein n=1 Tax=Phytophthora boehmeriae TaxID=109152 RepID=A0A8T1X4L0_9STRA|nr:hypothetical protein PHYBOEH_009130 [Phytophthora boehmeriae]